MTDRYDPQTSPLFGGYALADEDAPEVEGAPVAVPDLPDEDEVPVRRRPVPSLPPEVQHPAPVVVLRTGGPGCRWAVHRSQYRPADEALLHPDGWGEALPEGVAWELWHYPRGLREEGRLVCWFDRATKRVGWCEPPRARPPAVVVVRGTDRTLRAADLGPDTVKGAPVYQVRIGGRT